MASNRKRAHSYAIWRAYLRRCDKLVKGQQRTSQPGSPMRTTPGFFRAEGWSRRAMDRSVLRHGA